MSEPKKEKLPLKERLAEHLAEYGKVALVVYFSISILTIIGFYIAIKAGVDVGDSAASDSGALVAAWVAAKLTWPIRVGVTFLLTPVAAAVVNLFSRKSNPATNKSAENDESAGADA